MIEVPILSQWLPGFTEISLKDNQLTTNDIEGI